MDLNIMWTSLLKWGENSKNKSRQLTLNLLFIVPLLTLALIVMSNLALSCLGEWCQEKNRRLSPILIRMVGLLSKQGRLRRNINSRVFLFPMVEQKKTNRTSIVSMLQTSRNLATKPQDLEPPF